MKLIFAIFYAQSTSEKKENYKNDQTVCRLGSVRVTLLINNF